MDWQILREIEPRVRQRVRYGRIFLENRRVLLCRCKCGLEKEVLFQSIKTGRSTKCPRCKIEDQKTGFNVIEYNRRYSREHREERRLKTKEWRKKNPGRSTRSVRDYRQRFPEKAQAHWAVRRAIRNGTLVKAPCVVCGTPDVDGHHEDYARQLDVIWLCRIHHQERHQTKES